MPMDMKSHSDDNIASRWTRTDPDYKDDGFMRPNRDFTVVKTFDHGMFSRLTSDESSEEAYGDVEQQCREYVNRDLNNSRALDWRQIDANTHASHSPSFFDFLAGADVAKTREMVADDRCLHLNGSLACYESKSTCRSVFQTHCGGVAALGVVDGVAVTGMYVCMHVCVVSGLYVCVDVRACTYAMYVCM